MTFFIQHVVHHWRSRLRTLPSQTVLQNTAPAGTYVPLACACLRQQAGANRWSCTLAVQAQRRHEEGAAAAASSVVSSLGGALGSVSSIDSLNSQAASASSSGAAPSVD